jgi:hypothetical protein
MKHLSVLLGAVLIAAALSGCASVNTAADEVCLAYTGGPLEGTKYVGTYGPGSGLKWQGIADKVYCYPTTTRDYIVSSEADEGDRKGADHITATSYDKIEVRWEVAVYFKLNTAKGMIRKFHENSGLKFHAYDDDGWDQLLNNTLRQQLENAIQRESRLISSDELASGIIKADEGNPEVTPTEANESVIDRVQNGIATGLKENVNRVLGDDYFCGPTQNYGDDECPDLKVVLKRPTLPDGVMEAFQKQRTSEEGITTAQNNARIAEEQARGQQLSQDAVTNLTPEYLKLKEIEAMQACATNPECTLVFTPGNTNINVGP